LEESLISEALPVSVVISARRGDGRKMGGWMALLKMEGWMEVGSRHNRPENYLSWIGSG
jgi:hypothetical protein